MNFSSQRSNSAASGGSHPGRAWSWKRQAQQPPPKKKTELKQGSYSIYRLQWEKLKAFLEQRFPGHTFGERRVRVTIAVALPLSSLTHVLDTDLRSSN